MTIVTWPTHQMRLELLESGRWVFIKAKIPLPSVGCGGSTLADGDALTVQLMFSSCLAKSKAEEFWDHVLHAFEPVLGAPVTIEIRYDSRKDKSAGYLPVTLSASKDGSTQMPSARHYDITQK